MKITNKMINITNKNPNNNPNGYVYVLNFIMSVICFPKFFWYN